MLWHAALSMESRDDGRGHFPDRISALVWRNWNVAEPAQLAAIQQTSVANVQALAESLGLPPPTAVPPEMKTRGYITLVRRTWHLLPYDQLLELLEMTPKRLAVALRKDDFLWVKLRSRWASTRSPQSDRARELCSIGRLPRRPTG